jgi:hypothetical protein
MHGHVGFESLLERGFLMLADYDTGVEKNPSRTPARNHSGTPLGPAGTIWGKIPPATPPSCIRNCQIQWHGRGTICLTQIGKPHVAAANSTDSEHDCPVDQELFNGVIHEPADQALTSPDRSGREIPGQLLLFPAREHVLEHCVRGECSLTQRKPDQTALNRVHHASDASANSAPRLHKMRTHVKETLENRGIISLRGTSNPSTLRCPGLVPGTSSTRPASL